MGRTDSLPGPFGTNSAAISGIAGGGDINGDGIADLLLTSWTANTSSLVNAGQAYVIFGRTSFPASFDVRSLNGRNGFIVSGSAATIGSEAGGATWLVTLTATVSATS